MTTVPIMHIARIAQSMQRLEDFIASEFNVVVGELRAHTEYVDIDGSRKSTAYQTIEFGAKIESDGDDWTGALTEKVRSVLRNMRVLGAKTMIVRLPFALRADHVCRFEGDVQIIRGRVAFADGDGVPVRVPDWATDFDSKVGLVKVLSFEELEDLSVPDRVLVDTATVRKEAKELTDRAERVLSEQRAKNEIVSPGVVMISCGCDSGARCPQGRTEAAAQCHIPMDELDLIRITNDMVVARFESQRRQEASHDEEKEMLRDAEARRRANKAFRDNVIGQIDRKLCLDPAGRM